MASQPSSQSTGNLTAGQCMFRAYDALRGAAERFDADGESKMAARVRALARDVEDLETVREALRS